MIIPLSQGKYATVDATDLPILEGYTWCYTTNKWGGYATSTRGGKTVYMHRVLMGSPKGKQIDHINHDGLDNRRANLRIVTQSQNMANARRSIANKTGYKGVHFFKKANKFQASIYFDGKSRHIGLFLTAKEAARAYNRVASEVRGEFAYLNEGVG